MGASILSSFQLPLLMVTKRLRRPSKRSKRIAILIASYLNPRLTVRVEKIVVSIFIDHLVMVTVRFCHGTTVFVAGQPATNIEPPSADEEMKKEDGETTDEPKPRALHRTNSIFFRSLLPSITRQEIEVVRICTIN